MFGISSTEFAVIMVIALLMVGPKQLPDVLRILGRLYRKLNYFIKNASQVIDDALYDSDRIAEKAEKALYEDKDLSVKRKEDKISDE